MISLRLGLATHHDFLYLSFIHCGYSGVILPSRDEINICHSEVLVTQMIFHKLNSSITLTHKYNRLVQLVSGHAMIEGPSTILNVNVCCLIRVAAS